MVTRALRVLVVVNRVEEMDAAQTTWALAEELASRGHVVSVAGVANLGLGADDRVSARARRFVSEPGDEHTVDVSGIDLLLLRPNPGRDTRPWAHDVALELARRAQHHGVLVLNDPDALARARTKLFLAELPPDVRPRTLVSRDPAAIRAFVDEEPGLTVIKPLLGSRGDDVFFVTPRDANLEQVIAVVTRAGFAMVQEFVPEARDGDVRVLLLDGALLRDGEATAVVRRRPKAGELRSNVAKGGVPEHAAVDASLQRVIDAGGVTARRAGLFLVGLDVIGGKVVEANVFSPGGLHSASEFTGGRFVARIVDAIEARAYSRE